MHMICLPCNLEEEEEEGRLRERRAIPIARPTRMKRRRMRRATLRAKDPRKTMLRAENEGHESYTRVPGKCRATSSVILGAKCRCVPLSAMIRIASVLRPNPVCCGAGPETDDYDPARIARCEVSEQLLREVLLPAFTDEAAAAASRSARMTKSGTSVVGGKGSAQDRIFRWARTGRAPPRQHLLTWLLQRMRVGLKRNYDSRTILQNIRSTLCSGCPRLLLNRMKSRPIRTAKRPNECFAGRESVLKCIKF